MCACGMPDSALQAVISASAALPEDLVRAAKMYGPRGVGHQWQPPEAHIVRPGAGARAGAGTGDPGSIPPAIEGGTEALAPADPGPSEDLPGQAPSQVHASVSHRDGTAPLHLLALGTPTTGTTGHATGPGAGYGPASSHGRTGPAGPAVSDARATTGGHGGADGGLLDSARLPAPLSHEGGSGGGGGGGGSGATIVQVGGVVGPCGTPGGQFLAGTLPVPTGGGVVRSLPVATSATGHRDRDGSKSAELGDDSVAFLKSMAEVMKAQEYHPKRLDPAQISGLKK